MKKWLCLLLALVLSLGLCCASAESAGLPTYSYPFAEEDPLTAAVVDCMMRTDMGYEPEAGGVMIPAPVVIRTEMNGDETEATVYGNFWIFGYRLKGKVLEMTCGGENPGVMKLEKKDGQWAVTSFETAPEDGNLNESLRRFAGGDETLEKEYRIAGDAASGYLPQFRRSFIAEYVNANHLDIVAYQDYGWDPVDVRS